MSLRRFNKIGLRLVQELIYRIKIQAPKFHVFQKLATNLISQFGSKTLIARRPDRLPNLGRSFYRGFQRAVRPRLLRPFATLHHHHSRLREFEKSHGFNSILRGQLSRDVLERVRHIFGTNVRYNNALIVTEMPNSLEGYEIGANIACGCNGAVYELQLRKKTADNAENHYPLAIKIMFNYQFGAPDYVLWRQMGTEIIPLAPLSNALLRGGKMSRIKTLPRPHPNVIKLHTAFVDQMPILPGAENLYPDALPKPQDYEGGLLDEPRTLFVVMKRYHMTLREYLLGQENNDYWVGRLLFGQLLEAIVYLYQHKISHRDMKSDNILLDFNDSEGDVPHLVLSDFGSALASGHWTVHYKEDTVDLGGNLALRAPEIRRARPGPQTMANFEMADAWAVGTLAYEIFTRRNPFYAVLSSEKYSPADLPPLPHHIIEPIHRIVAELLSIDPKDRPKPPIAANVVNLSLLRFGHSLLKYSSFMASVNNCRHKIGTMFTKINETMDKKLRELVELYTAETILSRLAIPASISTAELQLRATFLARVEREGLCLALNYFAPKAGSIAEDGFEDNPAEWQTPI